MLIFYDFINFFAKILNFVLDKISKSSIIENVNM